MPCTGMIMNKSCLTLLSRSLYITFLSTGIPLTEQKRPEILAAFVPSLHSEELPDPVA